MTGQGKTAAEELAEAVARYRLRAEQEAALRVHEIGAEARDAESLVKRAQDFVEKSGIGKALAEIADEVRPWPAWVKRGDDLDRQAVTDVTGGTERTQHDDIDWCEFTRPDGTRWRIMAATSRHGSYGGDTVASFRSTMTGSGCLTCAASA